MQRHTRFQGAIVRDNQLLLIRHRALITGHEYWVFPGGGIEAGETEIECVTREMLEETGLEVRVERLLLDVDNPPYHFYRRQKTYLCTIVDGEPVPGAEPEEEASDYEITAVRWFDLTHPEQIQRELHDQWVYPIVREIGKAMGIDGWPPSGDDEMRYATIEVPGEPTVDVRGRDLEIRRPLENEIDALWQVFTETIASLQAAGIDQWDERYPTRDLLEADIASGSLWVAAQDGVPVGLVTAGDVWEPPYRDVRWAFNGTALYVHRLAVSPQARRRGIAAKLVDQIEREAELRRYDAVRLDAFVKNRASLELYRRRGYREAGRVHFAKGEFIVFEWRVSGEMGNQRASRRKTRRGRTTARSKRRKGHQE